ncbi:hypothetical protein F4821DRAFT_262180 [Hypoxylon rubiginosum]|uniref:Uncharacterized protein n=1 Tax=Hypoxylon rubiginosum TaxID=110542 RepID=A0ACC0CV00_9PEZI|nr:hypothetical protein F4821DRAFT_262180 [Hypoxylon rubiginosum]
MYSSLISVIYLPCLIAAALIYPDPSMDIYTAASAIETPTQSDELVQMTLFIKKRDNLTYEEFNSYWSGPHVKIFESVPIVRQNIVKYSQFHSNVSVNLPQLGFTPAGYDGGVNLWARSLEDLEAVFNDEEYLTVVVPNGKTFFKYNEMVAMYGWEEVKWDKE